MPSFRSIALATTAAAALLPAVASGKTYCVFKPDCTGTPEWSLQDAVSAAANDGEAGRIELGEGTYTFNQDVPEHPGASRSSAPAPRRRSSSRPTATRSSWSSMEARCPTSV